MTHDYHSKNDLVSFLLPWVLNYDMDIPFLVHIPMKYWLLYPHHIPMALIAIRFTGQPFVGS